MILDLSLIGIQIDFVILGIMLSDFFGMPLDALLCTIMFVLACGCLLIGYPVAFTLPGISLMFAGLGFAMGIFDFSFLGGVPQRIYGTMTNVVMMAVPLFVFMGVMLERSQIAEDLLASALDIAVPETTIDTSIGRFLQANDVTVVSSDGKKFLTGRNGKSIHYLNDGAAIIWQLLDEPTSISEAIEMLCAIYPDQPAEQIRTDVEATFREFALNNLLQKPEQICQPAAFEANLCQ